MSDSSISIFFIIFIGIIIFLFFRSEPLLCLYYLLTGIVFDFLMSVLAPNQYRGIFLYYVFIYLIAVRFVHAVVVQAPVRKVIIGIFSLLVFIGLRDY